MVTINQNVKTTLKRTTVLCSAVSALIFCGDVNAQQQSETPQQNETEKASTTDVIMVTAQRQSQSLNKVPISVSAMRGSELEERGVQNFSDLVQALPNVAMNSFFASRAEISIRGVAMSESWWSTDQPPVGVYLDDVFLGSRAVHTSQIFDLERVEFLRGPQGVLFGRNTTAGAVNYISKAPDEDFGGYVNVGYGNFDSGEISGAINIPINSKLAVRFSGKGRRSDGWAKNLFTDKTVMGYESLAGRAVIQYTGEASTWTLNIHGSDYLGNENFYFNSMIPENAGLAFNEFNQRLENANEDIEAWGTSLTGNIELGDIEVTSISSYETSDYFGVEDFGPGATGINNVGQFAQFFPYTDGSTDDFKQYSQEIRLSGSNGRIDWVGGVLGYYEDVNSQFSDGGFGTGTIGLDFNENGVIDVPDEGWWPEDDRKIWNQTTEEVAAFGHLSYSINDELSLFGGARYTYSKKELEWQYTDEFTGTDYVPKTKLADSWSPLTYRAGLEFTPDTNSLYYFRYDRGYKNGGFSVGGSTLADLIIVDPEKIDSFEVGSKLTLLDGMAQLNMAAFFNSINDYQANLIVFNSNGIGFALTNAAKVETKGLELEATIRPTESLLIKGGIGYTDAKFKNYVDTQLPADYSGNLIPVVPKWSTNVSVSYDLLFGNGGYMVTPRIDYAYTSEMQGRHYNRPQEVLDARNLVNAQVRIGGTSDDSISVTIWMKNILNEEYRTKIVGDSVFAAGLMEKRGWPRTFGITLGYKW